MANQWSPTEAARFDRYKEHVAKLGQREADAGAIAADKVEQEGGRPSRGKKISSDAGNGRKPIEHRTIEELYLLARQRKIPGRSRMNKAELIVVLTGEMSR